MARVVAAVAGWGAVVGMEEEEGEEEVVAVVVVVRAEEVPPKASPGPQPHGRCPRQVPSSRSPGRGPGPGRLVVSYAPESAVWHPDRSA